ncbi:MAG: glutamine-hydrolyzing GMP synthase [Bdellovibrionales bacterium]|nr:glutamine-hydrolyzing GMP synthase [Bdellovibrionales bacterium]
MVEHGVVILDFGSQYTQLIARRCREMGVFSELMLFDTPLEEIKRRKPVAIILSGGPNSVDEPQAPVRSVRELLQVAPVLGICYGMQLLAHDLGGKVERATKREYGFNEVHWKKKIFNGPSSQKVWMSHGDVITKAPPGAEVIGLSASDHPAAMVGERFWAVQFHPEVAHTESGVDFLRAFLFDFCKAKENWSSHLITDHLLNDIRGKVKGDERVLCALSGGVDSTVVATLLTKALGRDKVKCVFVDTGLLRKDEFEKVQGMYAELGLDVLGYDARHDFLSKLSGVEDPEAKRKIIGHTFIEVFKKAFAKVGTCQWLAQGTLYPDVIESVSPRGTSVTIKSHHNVGGLPKDLGLKLIEPLRELFKDEVRKIGADLGIPKKFLWRHPFPGPGLAIRLIGPITEEDLHILKEVDAIYIGELEKNGLYDKIWQAFCVLLPVKTVGVQGDNRTYDKVVALRAVTSTDGMTADWYPFDAKFMAHVSNRITNEVRGVNRVVYDVTSKPPGTIEWE